MSPAGAASGIGAGGGSRIGAVDEPELNGVVSPAGIPLTSVVVVTVVGGSGTKRFRLGEYVSS